MDGGDQLCIVRSTDKWAQSALDRVRSWIRVRSPHRSGPLHMHTYAGESCLYPFYKNQCVFCQWIFISSCPVLSGYESAVITQCNHKVYARRNLPVFLLQESVSCPVLSGDKSTVITRCKQGESCLYSFYKTQYVFARNFSSCPVLSGYKYAVITRGTQCESCLCILFPRINFYQEF